MHNHILKLFLKIITAAFLLVGCSDIEYTPDNTNDPESVSGQFLDAFVEGLNYSCSSGIVDLTDTNGSFTCNVDNNISFYLGSNTIATITIQEGFTTPYTLFPNSIDSALNLARLLQSLDADLDFNNTIISLDKTLELLLPQNLDFSSATFENDVQSALGIELVSINDAQVRLNSSILTAGGTLGENLAIPIANAGLDVNITSNSIVTLDASSSVATSYSWTFISKPLGSTVSLINSTTQTPSFIADINGTYEIALFVNASDINYDSDNIIVIVGNSIIAPPDVLTNNAPVINVASSIDVFENQTSALIIDASDDDNDILTYSISGIDSGSFNVNILSGVVSFKENPDYEVKNVYSITAKVSDSNMSDEQNININILNILEKPTLLDNTLNLNENSAIGSDIGQVTIVDHGDETITTFTLSGDNSEYFDIDSSGLVTAIVSFDYEFKTSYALSVSATNSIGISEVVDLNISIINLVDVAPTLVNTILSFREDAVSGNIVGDITIDNAGDSAISSIALVGTGASNFEVDTAGEIKIKAGSSFDYETTHEYNITAQATNSTGLSNIVNIGIEVNNVIDEVPIIVDFAGSIDENATIVTSIGTLSITYIGDSNITNVDLSGTGSDYFSIANDGVITLVEEDILDFESVPSYLLTAIATNTAGDSNIATITITVGDVPEVAIIQNSTMTIMENELEGAIVGSITFKTTGDSAITDINLSGSGNANFISDINGQITLSSSSSIDYETVPSYTLGVVATNAAGTSLSATLTISIEDFDFDPTKIADLNANDGEVGDNFGSSVAISGNFIVVGAPNEDAGAIVDGGSIYLYKKDKVGVVSQLSKLMPTVPKPEEYFGFSVDIDANVIVVGAPENDNGIGNVYIYLIDVSDGVPLPPQQIGLSVGSIGDSFGMAVAISGDYIVVGAPSQASAHLFKLDANQNAVKVADITAGLSASDSYGSSIAIDGNYIVIGAKDKDISSNDEGGVYVYEINPSNDSVSLIGSINSSTPVGFDNFGKSVGVSGSYVVVGANGVDDIATNSGYAYMYKIGTGSVSLTDTFAPNISPNSLEAVDYFGYSIDISGEYIVVGAYKKDFGVSIDTGSAYIYHIDTNSDTASMLEKLDSPSLNTEDYFSTSVKIDGNFILIGSPNDDTKAVDAGTVYLYDGEPIP